VYAITEGIILGSYSYRKHKTSPSESASVASVTIIAESGTESRLLTSCVRRAQTVCEATVIARDLENAPGNEIYPESLAAEAKKAGRAHGFSVKVFDERRIRALGMGGLTAVGQGSSKPPRFILMEYNPGGTRKQKTAVLVGKGITFDSGGISIKPSANMAEMKMDMSGAAAVIGTLCAAADLKLPVRIIGLIPAAENLPGGRALKPGDIITHLNGKTSEVDNTDAEGRLVLADALAYATRFKPDVVIDLATLTGAVVVALGHYATGMLGNNDAVMAQLKAAGEETYERVWQLPMFEEYERLVRSDVADVKNVGGRWGGAITGAMFLKQFIGDYPWVHLDIAGTAIIEEATEYVPKGGSGVGVRLLIEFLGKRYS
jgi:leucyl aminopeptidase